MKGFPYLEPGINLEDRFDEVWGCVRGDEFLIDVLHQIAQRIYNLEIVQACWLRQLSINNNKLS